MKRIAGIELEKKKEEEMEVLGMVNCVRNEVDRWIKMREKKTQRSTEAQTWVELRIKSTLRLKS